MRTSIKAMAVTAAATGVMAVGGATAQADNPDLNPAAPAGPPGSSSTSVLNSAQASAVWKNVWHSAPSYYGGDGGMTGGELNAGSNYFYCQGQGMDYSFDGYVNDWWLKTDDDSGNSNVWVSAVYVSGGDDWEPIPGVPYC